MNNIYLLLKKENKLDIVKLKLMRTVYSYLIEIIQLTNLKFLKNILFWFFKKFFKLISTNLNKLFSKI